jgi:PIN domain nuclease of toxin-antitoxin system
MRLLLDTHALLWFVSADPKLSLPAQQAIADPGNQKFVSIVSLWEIAIKHSLGRLDLQMPLADFINQHLTPGKITLLSMSIPHLLKVDLLPHLHRDPFDRLLIAQALTENLLLVSADAAFAQYGVPLIW